MARLVKALMVLIIFLGRQDMWMRNSPQACLQVDTAIGPRFVQLNIKQRAYLL